MWDLFTFLYLFRKIPDMEFAIIKLFEQVMVSIECWTDLVEESIFMNSFEHTLVGRHLNIFSSIKNEQESRISYLLNHRRRIQLAWALIFLFITPICLCNLFLIEQSLNFVLFIQQILVLINIVWDLKCYFAILYWV